MIDHEMKLNVYSQQDLLDAGCFDMAAAIRVVEEAFVNYANGEVVFPDKVSVVFDEMTQDRINCLPAAIIPEKVYGMKWVSVFPENPHKRNKSNLTAVYLLSELESGYPVALLEGSLCSNIRTAAVGGLGAKYFARKNSETIGFIGAGEQAKAHFLSMKAVLPGLKICKVASRTQESERIFVEQMKKFYPNVEFITCNGHYEKAARNSDVIVTAISGQEKILQADWIQEGAYYCHVAGLEDDFGVAQKADKIVCDDWAVVKHRTQTISQMYHRGLLTDDAIYANLYEIVTGKKPGRQTEKEFVYFNSVGLSFVDVKLANWMYKKAALAGKGQEIMLKSKSMFEI